MKRQLSQDIDEMKPSNHSFATSTPAHKQIKHDLTGVSLQESDLGKRQLSPAKATKLKDILSKFLHDPSGSQECKNDTFDSTLTLEKPLSPIRTKQEKLNLSPLKHELHPGLPELNTIDEMGSLAATKFNANDAPLSCEGADETFDEALKTYAHENELSLGMSFQEWVERGFQNAETQRKSIERLAVNRLILLQRFHYLNSTINEYAVSLETTRRDFDVKVKKLRVLTNEFINDIT